jgi:multidrug efflux pump subunit AcrB
MDFSINTLTLFGLILAIGIVVDDAIIVVENVESNLEKNPDLSVKEATKIAMKEVFAPVISTTLVLLAVFVPVTFIPGISGALYQQFATTIAFAVIISSINALTLSPALCATLLKRKQKNSQNEEKKSFIFEKFDNALENFKKLYKKILEKIIKYWQIAALIYILLLGATYFAFKSLPTGFIPNEDQGTLVASVSLQAGTTLNKTEDATEKIVELIKETQGIKDVISVAGFNLINGALDSSSATIFLVLEDWEQRTTKDTSIDAITNIVNQKANEQIKTASVRVFNMPSIPGLSAVGGFEVKLQNLQSMNIKDFEQRANEFIKKLNEDDSIMMAYTSFNSNYPQYYIDINRDKVATLDLKLNDVFSVLQTYLGSLYVNDFNKYGKTYRVFLQADQDFRAEKNSINNFFVKSTKGDIVPLSAIVEIKRTSGVSTITHFNSYQSIAINGVHNIKGGYSSGDALNAIEQIAKETLGSEVGYEFAGMSLQEKEAGNAAI